MTRRHIFGIPASLAVCCVLVSCSKQLPVLSMDPIPNGGVVKGVVSFTGWATQPSGIRSVILYVDAKRTADATVHVRRPDVPKTNSGWVAKLDVSPLFTGVHYLTAMAHANDGTYSQQTVSIVVIR